MQVYFCQQGGARAGQGQPFRFHDISDVPHLERRARRYFCFPRMRATTADPKPTGRGWPRANRLRGSSQGALVSSFCSLQLDEMFLHAVPEKSDEKRWRAWAVKKIRYPAMSLPSQGATLSNTSTGDLLCLAGARGLQRGVVQAELATRARFDRCLTAWHRLISTSHYRKKSSHEPNALETDSCCL